MSGTANVSLSNNDIALKRSIANPYHENLSVHSARRGRIQFQKSADKFPEESYGNSIHSKNPAHIRIFILNMKDLSQTATGNNFRYYAHSIRELQVNIGCLAETHTPWQLTHHRQDFFYTAKSSLGNVKVEFASPSHTIDPISETESFQVGENLLMVCGKWVPSIFGSPIKDNMGQWCGITIRGKHGNTQRVITAYRVCNGHIDTAPIGSSFAREYEFLNDPETPNPTHGKRLLTILLLQIRRLLDAPHHVM